MIKKFFLMSIIVLVLSAPVLSYGENHDAGDADSVRIEDDFSLSYPDGKSDEIVDYLRGKYIDDTSFMEQLGSEFTASYGDEDFTDTYFDTPALDLAQRKAGLRHRVRLNRLDPDNLKNGRELVQLKLSNNDKLDDEANIGSRNELKYDVRYPKKFESTDDSHSLIGIIDLKQREEFKARVEEILDIDPYKLKPILTIQQHRRRVYINRNDAVFISFSIDDATSGRWWAKAHFSQMELELNEIAYTDADEATRVRMQELRTGMVKDLRDHFAFLQDDTSIKYTKMFDLIVPKILFMRFWIKIGLM